MLLEGRQKVREQYVRYRIKRDAKESPGKTSKKRFHLTAVQKLKRAAEKNVWMKRTFRIQGKKFQ